MIRHLGPHASELIAKRAAQLGFSLPRCGEPGHRQRATRNAGDTRHFSADRADVRRDAFLIKRPAAASHNRGARAGQEPAK